MNRHIVFSFLIFTLLQACNADEEQFMPERRTVVEAVYASATMNPAAEVELVALAEGTLITCFVQEGDMVEVGQPLFEIRNTVQQARLQAAADALKLAQTNAAKQSPLLREQEVLLENAKARYLNDSIRWERYAKLAKSEIGTKMDYEKAELAFQTSKNEWLNVLLRYQRLQDQTKQEKLQAEAAHAAAMEEMRNYKLISDRKAMVFDVLKEKGDMVRRGEMLAVLGAGESTQLKLKVDEADIQKIKLGQKVIVRLDILPDSIFEAKISRINPRLNRKEQAFTVEAVFEQEPGLQLSGLNAEANIIIQKRENILTIPKTLVHQDTVWVLQGGERAPRRIKTGLSDSEWVEVLSGLDEKSVLVQK